MQTTSEEEDAGALSAAPDVAKESVSKAGWLLKRSNKNKRKWKRRWFVLRGLRLSMYKTEEEYKLKKMLKLKDAFAASLHGRRHKEPMFAIASPAKIIYVQADTIEDMESWIDAINKTTGAVVDEATKLQFEDDIVSAAEASNAEAEHATDAQARPVISEHDAALEGKETVIISGYLDIRTHLRKKWKRRWLVLRSTGRLMGYGNSEEFELLKLIKRKAMVEVGPYESDRRQNCFKLVMAEGHNYTFSADSPELAKKWIEAIEEQIRLNAE